MMSEENMLTKQTDHVDSLMDRLRQAADEIDDIKTSFSKSSENLSRIQNMLDVGGLSEISGIIEKFENQLIEAERKREEASEGAKRYSQELEKEKERLIKLWDAYKNQEEELSKTEMKLSDAEEQIRKNEEIKNQIEENLNEKLDSLNTKLQQQEQQLTQLDNYKKRCDEFTTIKDKLEEETHSFKEDIKKKEQTIASLEKQVKELKEFEKFIEFKDKFEEVSQQYEKEKERLTKLYHLYEETENECNVLKEQNDKWNEWYNSNKDIFNKLFSAAPPTASVHKKEAPKTPVKEEDKKKKIRFKK